MGRRKVDEVDEEEEEEDGDVAEYSFNENIAVFLSWFQLSNATPISFFSMIMSFL